MRLWRKILAGCAGITCLIGSSFALDQGDLIKPIERELTFIFIPKLIHPWYEEVQAGIKAAVEEAAQNGIALNIIWDAPPQADISDHNARIEVNIGRRPDGLAVSCLDPGTNTSLLQEAVRAKLHLITFDTFCSEQFPFVGEVDPSIVGRQIGMALAEKLQGKGKIAILAGSLTAPNHVGRSEGFKQALSQFPEMQIVFEQPDNDDLERAVSLTENALQAHRDLAAIFGNNASNPVGAARAVKNAGLTGKVLVVGTNMLDEALSFVEDGTIHVVGSDRQWEMGYWSVKYLIALNQGHSIPHAHVTGTNLITKETLNQ